MATREAIDILKQARSLAKGAVTRKVAALEKLMAQASYITISKETLTVRAGELEQAVVKFQEACDKYEPYADGDPADYIAGS